MAESKFDFNILRVLLRHKKQETKKFQEPVTKFQKYISRKERRGFITRILNSFYGRKEGALVSLCALISLRERREKAELPIIVSRRAERVYQFTICYCNGGVGSV